MDYFDVKTWKSWIETNSKQFVSLKEGAKIAMLLPDTDNIIVLEKLEKGFDYKIDNQSSFEFPFAQIALKFTSQGIEDFFNNVSLRHLVKTDKMGILSFVNSNELRNMGFNSFLKRCGYGIQSSCSCGCC